MARRRKTDQSTLPTEGRRGFGRGLNIDGYPTVQEWESMKPYGSFIITDDKDNGPKYEFCIGNHALILPEGADPEKRRDTHQYWVCVIKDIRSGPSKDVWAQVRWYFAAKDLVTEYATLDTTTIGRYERLLSDDHDMIHMSSFESVITMHYFKESDTDQAIIPNGDLHFYIRYILDHASRSVNPKPARECTCRVPYNPDSDIMHFCPRPTCRTWYHTRCLNVPRRRRSSTQTTFFDPLNNEPSHSSAKRNLRSSGLTPTTSSSATRKGKQKVDLPDELLQIAKSPIVRGAEYGVAGNVRAVLRARQLVSAMLDGSLEQEPPDWSESVDAGKALRTAKLANEREEALMCPACEGLM